MEPQPNGGNPFDNNGITVTLDINGPGVQGRQKTTFAFKPFEFAEEPDISYSDLISERDNELAKKEEKIKQLEKDLNESKCANDELKEMVAGLCTTNEDLTRSCANTKQTLEELTTKHNAMVTAANVANAELEEMVAGLCTTNEALTRSSANTEQKFQKLITTYNVMAAESTGLQQDFNTLLGHVLRILKLDSTKFTSTTEIFTYLDWQSDAARKIVSG